MFLQLFLSLHFVEVSCFLYLGRGFKAFPALAKALFVMVLQQAIEKPLEPNGVYSSGKKSHERFK